MSDETTLEKARLVSIGECGPMPYVGLELARAVIEMHAELKERRREVESFVQKLVDVQDVLDPTHVRFQREDAIGAARRVVEELSEKHAELVTARTLAFQSMQKMQEELTRLRAVERLLREWRTIWQRRPDGERLDSATWYVREIGRIEREAYDALAALDRKEGT